MAEVKLFMYVTSPFSRRIEMALGLKGVSYDCFNMDTLNKEEVYDQYNPIYRKIPVLVHDGHNIPESLIILEYVDEAWGGYPILPKDPYERAHARFFAHFIDDKCLGTFRTGYWVDGEVGQKGIQQSKEYLTILEKELKGKKFFGGDSIGYLDIAANYVALWLPALQEVAGVDIFNEKEHPALWRWSQDFINSDIGKKFLPEKQVLVNFFNGRKEMMKAYFNKPAN